MNDVIELIAHAHVSTKMEAVRGGCHWRVAPSTAPAGRRAHPSVSSWFN